MVGIDHSPVTMVDDHHHWLYHHCTDILRGPPRSFHIRLVRHDTSERRDYKQESEQIFFKTFSSLSTGNARRAEAFTPRLSIGPHESSNPYLVFVITLTAIEFSDLLRVASHLAILQRRPQSVPLRAPQGAAHWTLRYHQSERWAYGQPRRYRRLSQRLHP